jgi:predicted XRE-type DNA-binding protein
MAEAADREKEVIDVITHEPAEDIVMRGSGNVFADLGLPNPEERLAKARLVQILTEIIAEKKLSQSRAATRMGIDQPTLSKLLGGRTSGFSLERLFGMLALLGQDVDISVRSREVEVAVGRIAVGRLY